MTNFVPKSFEALQLIGVKLPFDYDHYRKLYEPKGPSIHCRAQAQQYVSLSDDEKKKLKKSLDSWMTEYKKLRF